MSTYLPEGEEFDWDDSDAVTEAAWWAVEHECGPASDPRFAPEDELDEYRDAWESGSDDLREFSAEVTVYGTNHGVTEFPLTPAQAHHILAYLSEQSRKGNA